VQELFHPPISLCVRGTLTFPRYSFWMNNSFSYSQGLLGGPYPDPMLNGHSSGSSLVSALPLFGRSERLFLSSFRYPGGSSPWPQFPFRRTVPPLPLYERTSFGRKVMIASHLCNLLGRHRFLRIPLGLFFCVVFASRSFPRSPVSHRSTEASRLWDVPRKRGFPSFFSGSNTPHEPWLASPRI